MIEFVRASASELVDLQRQAEEGAAPFGAPMRDGCEARPRGFLAVGAHTQAPIVPSVSSVPSVTA
jgi:hypothetical protein